MAHERLVKLDKHQRSMLQEMDPGELLGLVLEPLRAKVTEMGLEDQAKDLLELIDAERAANSSFIKCKKKVHFRKIMARMSIAGLVGVAGCGQTPPRFREKLLALVEGIRCQLP